MEFMLKEAMLKLRLVMVENEEQRAVCSYLLILDNPAWVSL